MADRTIPARYVRLPIGLNDMHGKPIHLGDRVRYNLEGKHTKKEYWNPEYLVIWEAPAFTLAHVGGGKDGGDPAFRLKHGGGNGDLEIVSDETS